MKLTKEKLPRPHLYLFIFSAWVATLSWFHVRMWSLLEAADSTFAWMSMVFFIVFTGVAWLYGFYNLGVVLFATIYRRREQPVPAATLPSPAPGVAILYTTCNDFVESSAESCLAQDYPDFTVYLLDDSAAPEYQRRVDAFALRHPDRVRVVRRSNREGFKAGNINHGLSRAATREPLFALVDADELLPPDFLTRLVPRLLADPQCGFVQANHKCREEEGNSLGKALGVGIDIHWRWYHPLRNRYGFVMLLGHGAVIRRACWEKVGGFPHVVSEDLAFALRVREAGWRGKFVEDVVCYEDFPQDIRAFRVRHMKWTRGTCELLRTEFWRLLFSRRISLVEKLDILFPTLNLPLSIFFFLFVLDTNIIFPQLFGQPSPLTFAVGGSEIVLPAWQLSDAFRALHGPDFFLITLLTLLSPILCFMIELAPRPGELFRFLSKSTTVYGALGPISALGVFFYLLTGKAVFHVTGDASGGASRRGGVAGTHPDHPVIQGFEVLTGVTLGLTCLMLFQISFLGIALAYILLPVFHHVPWSHRWVQRLVHVPFLLLVGGLGLGLVSVIGLQPVFFGYGFHF